MKHVIMANTADNVANALDDIEPGDSVACSSKDGDKIFTAADRIPFGFKMALASIPAGADIIKYGEVIGRASCDIAAGSCVHVHNVEGCRGRGDKQEG